MQSELRAALDQLLQGQSLDAAVVQPAIGALMDGRCDEAEIAALLTAFAVKGVTEGELAGAARAMRDRATPIRSTRTGLLDTCGTGGDHLRTFNISTAAALVVASLGVPVAKHGNRSVSSSSGSADVLEQLGVTIDLPADLAGQCLDEVGICFCFARTCHTAMKHVAPTRQKLGFRTIFNLLGPLTNPASAEFQLLGAPRYRDAQVIAGAAAQLTSGRTLVVSGNDQLDEVALWGTTRVWDVHAGEVREMQWTAASFGLSESSPDALQVSSPQESAEVIRRIVSGERSAACDIVLANAAAALYCSGHETDLPAAIESAAESIDSGAVRDLLESLTRWTQQTGAGQQAPAS